MATLNKQCSKIMKSSSKSSSSGIYLKIPGMDSSSGGASGLSGNEGSYWSVREKWIWFLTLLSGTSFLYSSRTTMPLVAPAVAQQLHWSKTEVGTVLSSFFWGYTLTQVLGGYLADKFGAERVLLAAGLGWGLLTFWFRDIVYLVGDHDNALFVIVLSRILLGACQGVHFPALASISSRNLNPRDRSFFFSACTAGGAIGTLITGSLGSYLNEHFDWPSVFYAVGLFGLIWVSSLKYYAMSLNRNKKYVIGMGANHLSVNAVHSHVPWLIYLRSKALWACVFCHFCQNNCFFILISWLPTYFHDNFPNEKGWVFNVVPWLVMIPGIVMASFFVQRLFHKGYSVGSARKIAETICILTESSCLFLIGVAGKSSFTLSVFFFTCAVGGNAFHKLGTSVNVIDIAPQDSGSVLGIVNTFGSIGGFIGVYISGYILEVTGSWAAVFNLTAVVNIAGIIVFILFGSGKPIL